MRESESLLFFSEVDQSVSVWLCLFSEVDQSVSVWL